MSYRIIGDSCTDLTEDLKKYADIALVPLTLQVDDEIIVDDETFNQAHLLESMKKSKHCLKSACPSPEAFMKYFDSADDIYVITITSQLSGSYNSAEVARTMYLEEHPNKNIVVIDSRSASIGQTLLAKHLYNILENGASFTEASASVLKYRDELNTKFVLETLEVFRRNGRLSTVKATLCNTLNIKVVMTALEDGSIDKVDQARGMKKTLEKMVTAIAADAISPAERILGIAHCNNQERALFVKDIILEKIKFKDVIIVNTGGLSSFYANEGGIIVAY